MLKNQLGHIMKNFALTGAAGYIAVSTEAIKDINNLTAMDRFDSVGIIDSFFQILIFLLNLNALIDVYK